MPRERKTTRSERRYESFTRDQLFSEIHSIMATPNLTDSWGSILSDFLAVPVLDDLSDLQRVLEDLTNGELIKCALTLGPALESSLESALMLSTRKSKKRRSSSVIRVTGEEWTRAQKRRFQGRSRDLQLSKRSEAQHEISSDNTDSELQELVATQQREIEALKIRLLSSEQRGKDYLQQLSVTKADIAAAREKTDTDFFEMHQRIETREAALRRVQAELDRAVEAQTGTQKVLHETKIKMQKKETALETVSENLRSCETQRKNAHLQLMNALATVSQQDMIINDLENQLQDQSSFPGVLNLFNGDATVYRTDNYFPGGGKQPWSVQSVEGPMSQDDQYNQGDEVSQFKSWTTVSSERDDNTFTPTSEFSPACCGQIPVAETNAGCKLCRDHCEQFTCLSLEEMGTTSRIGVTACPACDQPWCESAQLLSCGLASPMSPRT